MRDQRRSIIQSEFSLLPLHRPITARDELPPLMQIRTALRRGNRLGLVFGAIYGAWMPIAAFILKFEADAGNRPEIWFLIAAAMVFSGITVFHWMRQSFGSSAKAFGFMVCLDGAMLFSELLPLRISALILLILVNALASACNLALRKKTLAPIFQIDPQ